MEDNDPGEAALLQTPSEKIFKIDLDVL